MTRKFAISEILEQAAQKTSDADKINFLYQHQSEALKTVLQYALHPGIKWALPPGAPPYKPTDFLDQEGMLYMEARRLYLFVEGGNNDLKKVKREMMFIGLLESIHKKDAELLLAAKEKKLPYPSITANIINAAFPGLLPDEQVS